MTERIRILYCMETIGSGGVERRRLSLARYFDRERYELKLICTKAIGALPDLLRKQSVEIIEVGTFSHPFHWSKHALVRKVMRTFKPHIVHGATFEGNSMASINGLLMEVPVRILEETSDPQNRKQRANWLLKTLTYFCTRIIAISPFVKEYLVSSARINSKKVITITNGVERPCQTNEKAPSILAELDAYKVVGFVGRLYDDHKKVSDLLRAFARISADTKLLIVGDGVDRDSIEYLIQQLQLTDRVLLVGYQPDTFAFFKKMDVFVIPSSREGFGLVAAEAMLHGLPVIATSVGALTEIVADGTSGFLVPPGNVDQLSEKISTLLKDPTLRKSMGEAGYQRAMTHYTAERYCRDIEKLYLDLLAEKGIVV